MAICRPPGGVQVGFAELTSITRPEEPRAFPFLHVPSERAIFDAEVEQTAELNCNSFPAAAFTPAKGRFASQKTITAATALRDDEKSQRGQVVAEILE